MAAHSAACPACGAPLIVNVLPHTGGMVEEDINVQLAPVPEPETPLAETAEESGGKPESETPVVEAAEETAEVGHDALV